MYFVGKRGFENPIQAKRYCDAVLLKIGTCCSLKFYYPKYFKMFKKLLKLHPHALQRGIVDENGEYILKDIAVNVEDNNTFQMIVVGSNKIISRINYFKAIVAQSQQTLASSSSVTSTTLRSDISRDDTVYEAAMPLFVNPMLEEERHVTPEQIEEACEPTPLRRSQRVRRAPARLSA